MTLTSEQIYDAIIAANAILTRAWATAQDPYSRGKALNAQIYLDKESSAIARAKCDEESVPA